MERVEGIDYAAVLADLEQRRAQLDAAIAVIRPLVGLPAAEGSANSAPRAPAGGIDIQDDTFFGLSAADAAERFLGIQKKATMMGEIVTALQAGGWKTTAKNPYANLFTAMSRDGRFMKIGRGKWGLAKWYPGARQKAKDEKNGKTVSDDSSAGESDQDG